MQIRLNGILWNCQQLTQRKPGLGYLVTASLTSAIIICKTVASLLLSSQLWDIICEWPCYHGGSPHWEELGPFYRVCDIRGLKQEGNGLCSQAISPSLEWGLWTKQLLAFYSVHSCEIPFSGKLSKEKTGENTIFVEKTVTDCSLLQRQRMPRPKLRRENFRV